VVQLDLPMPVKKVSARQEVKQDGGRLALQRGPLVYCVEGADNKGKAWNFVMPADTQVETLASKVLNEPIMALVMKVPVFTTSADGKAIQTEVKPITAIPYYAWANRGQNEMQVWLPTSVQSIRINP
jgi:uncharacterized protein